MTGVDGRTYAVVVPTVGRPSLRRLLELLHTAAGPPPREIVLVDDRVGDNLPPLVPDVPPERVRVVRSGGRGPAAARNAGWRAADAEWIAFLDDDVEPSPDWPERLADDIDTYTDAPGPVAGIQGALTVPLPSDRPPTDWERSVAGLADARWATADMAYRRDVLADVGGFDERFPRAYREDVDLAIRVQRAGHWLAVGRRRCRHPVRREDRWISVRSQRGNADDALLRRLHGRRWRDLGDVPAGRRARHVAITTAAAAALGAAAAGCLLHGRARGAAYTAAGLVATGALAGIGEFAWARIAPGPRTRPEVVTMVASSVTIPPLATAHWVRGWLRSRGATAWSPERAETR